MELNYEQIVSNNYKILNLEGEDYIVSSHFPVLPIEKTIAIYKSQDDDISFEMNEADRLYEILSQATTLEKILNFCKNYGTLVNYKSPIKEGRFFRTSTQITNAYLIDKETLSNNDIFYHTVTTKDIQHLVFDHMHINHFNYYVYTLKLLDELYNENTKYLSFESAVTLMNNLKKYRSYTYTMLAIEYNFHSGLYSYLSAFPFYQYVLRISDDLFSQEEECDPRFFTYLHWCLCQIPSKVNDYDAKDKELYISRVKRLTQQIYADIINFHMKDIPFSLLTSALYDPACISFFTLGDGIIFQKILDITSSNRKKRCKNELCNNYFRPNGKKVLYCCAKCRIRYHNRISMRKKRKTSKNSSFE